MHLDIKEALRLLVTEKDQTFYTTSPVMKELAPFIEGNFEKILRLALDSKSPERIHILHHLFWASAFFKDSKYRVSQQMWNLLSFLIIYDFGIPVGETPQYEELIVELFREHLKDPKCPISELPAYQAVDTEEKALRIKYSQDPRFAGAFEASANGDFI